MKLPCPNIININNMIKPISSIPYCTIIFISMASLAYADMVWPALYVANSHLRFWYVVIVGLLLETCVLRRCLKIHFKKALLVSLVANTFSASVGIYAMTFSMLGWHFIVDNFVHGTFNSFNKIATITIMLLGSTFIETLIVRGIWKYQLRQTLPIFILGNILSYSVIVADLYFFGGWNKQF